jgi:hypothetical protein
MGENDQSAYIKGIRWQLSYWYAVFCSWLVKREWKMATVHDYVQYRCGHQKWVSFPRIKAERRQKQEWLIAQLCSDCYRQSQRDQRIRQTFSDLEEARIRGLVDLRGSEAMITWALRIRAECLAEIDRRFEQKRGMPGATEEVLQRGLSACIRAMNRQTAASWWIDHLGDLPQTLTLDYLRELMSGSLEGTSQRSRNPPASNI